MTEDRLPLNELLQKAGDGDFLRAVAESVLQLLMEADVEGLIGAGRHERAADRLNWRNGYRDRTLETRLGSLNLKIPKLRAGSYFPPFLEARKTTEKALSPSSRRPGSAGCRRAGSTRSRRRWGFRASRRARSRNCARKSTSALRPSSNGRSKATGPICGCMRPT